LEESQDWRLSGGHEGLDSKDLVTHTLAVRATDAAGNQDGTPASFTTRVKRKK